MLLLEHAINHWKIEMFYLKILLLVTSSEVLLGRVFYLLDYAITMSLMIA